MAKEAIYSSDFVEHIDGRKGRVSETFHFQGSNHPDTGSALVRWTNGSETRVMISTLRKLSKKAEA